MAAAAFKLYNRAKRHIGAGLVDLSAASGFRMSLVQSASNFATATLNLLGSLTNEVAEGAGYSSSGFALASGTWTAGASAGQIRWDAADPAVVTASGGTIANIKGAVIWNAGTSAGNRYLVAYASLTSSQFTLGDGSTLTLGFNANGILTLV